LNPATLAYLCPFLYLNEWPDKGFTSNCASIKINGLHNIDVLAKFNINNADGTEFWSGHGWRYKVKS